jgi:hypothetical protein
MGFLHLQAFFLRIVDFFFSCSLVLLWRGVGDIIVLYSRLTAAACTQLNGGAMAACITGRLETSGSSSWIMIDSPIGSSLRSVCWLVWSRRIFQNSALRSV